jgi:hypothetical protein
MSYLQSTMKQESNGDAATGSLRHNATFFFADGDLILTAGGQTFQIHSYLFRRESEESRVLWVHLDDDPEHIVHLENVKSAELESFLQILYIPFVMCPSFWRLYLMLIALDH